MTEPEHIDFNDLIGLARDKSVEGRTRLVQIVGDLFFDTDIVLRDAERNIMSDILRQLIHDVEMKVRQQLAMRMADENDAPRELVSALATNFKLPKIPPSAWPNAERAVRMSDPAQIYSALIHAREAWRNSQDEPEDAAEAEWREATAEEMADAV